MRKLEENQQHILRLLSQRSVEPTTATDCRIEDILNKPVESVQDFEAFNQMLEDSPDKTKQLVRICMALYNFELIKCPYNIIIL